MSSIHSTQLGKEMGTIQMRCPITLRAVNNKFLQPRNVAICKLHRAESLLLLSTAEPHMAILPCLSRTGVPFDETRFHFNSKQRPSTGHPQRIHFVRSNARTEEFYDFTHTLAAGVGSTALRLGTSRFQSSFQWAALTVLHDSRQLLVRRKAQYSMYPPSRYMRAYHTSTMCAGLKSAYWHPETSRSR